MNANFLLHKLAKHQTTCCVIERSCFCKSYRTALTSRQQYRVTVFMSAPSTISFIFPEILMHQGDQRASTFICKLRNDWNVQFRVHLLCTHHINHYTPHSVWKVPQSISFWTCNFFSVGALWTALNFQHGKLLTLCIFFLCLFFEKKKCGKKI